MQRPPIFFILACAFALGLAPHRAWAHREGITVDQTRPAFFNCRDSQGSKNFPVTSRYLLKIFNKIYAHNKEALGLLPNGVDDFCIAILQEIKPNAFAVVETGKIAFTPRILRIFASEEEAASVLSHELGHIAMYHADPIPFELRVSTPENILKVFREVLAKKKTLFESRASRQAFYTIVRSKLRSAIAENPNNAKRILDLAILERQESLGKEPMNYANMEFHPLYADDSIYTEQALLLDSYGIPRSAFNECHEAVLKLLAEIEPLENILNAFYGDKLRPDIFTNFREREADEVGLEFYVRAGYAPEKFIEYLYTLVAVKTPGISTKQQAKAYCDEKSASGKSTQGNWTHPQPCWRIENIKAELIIHKAYYESLALLREKPMAEPSFAEMQEELR